MKHLDIVVSPHASVLEPSLETRFVVPAWTQTLYIPFRVNVMHSYTH